MNVGELKKQLKLYPDDLELFVNVEFVEEEDCGELSLSATHMSMNENGTSIVLEYDTPYI